MTKIQTRFLFLTLMSITFLQSQAQQSFYELIQLDTIPYEYAGTAENKNTVFAVVQPAGCSRCEGSINLIIDELKNKDSLLKFTIIIVAKNYEAAKNYYSRNNWNFDNIVYDTLNKFANYVRDYNSQLLSPYFFRLDSQRKIINYFPLLGLNMENKDYVKNFLDNQIDISWQHLITKPKLNNTKYKELSNATLIGTISDNISSFYPITKDRILWINSYTNTISLFEPSKNRIKTISPSLKEQKFLVSKDIDSITYEILIKNNILKTLYVGIVKNADLKKIRILASLPKVSIEKEGNEYNITYSNKIAIIDRFWDNDSIHIDTSILDNTDWVLIHNNAFTSSTEETFIPVQRGWPCVGVGSLHNASLSENPFSDSFYTKTPLFARFDKHRKVSYAGAIDVLTRKMKLGYFLTIPTFAESNEYIFMNTGYSNLFFRFRKSEFENPLMDTFYIPINSTQFTFFDDITKLEFDDQRHNEQWTIKNITLKDLDNPIKYYQEINQTLSNQCIQLVASGNNLYVLTQSIDKIFNIFIYSLNKKEIVKRLSIPRYYNDKIRLEMASIVDNNKQIKVFCVYTSSSQSKIVSYLVE